MNAILTLVRWLLVSAMGLFLFGVLSTAGIYFYLAPGLPDIEVLKDVQLQVPLRVHARDGELIAEYGEMKRTPIRYGQVPDLMVKAFLAAEDDRFFEHPGVDYQGILRAAYVLATTGEKTQGGSTITMQVARNFFLTREKTYLRKLSEIFLALKIEQELGKEEILELYLNKIYLGHRSYGVGAAAKVYYGRELAELNLPQMAMIAGLPKAPSRDNPITNPDRALERRNYVLRRMHEVGYIDQATYEGTLTAPVSADLHIQTVELEAPYIGEMVRAEMVRRYGEAAYSDGYVVHTTIEASLQGVANRALRNALLAYERRHGYRGPTARVELTARAGFEEWDAALADRPTVGDLLPAVVVGLEARTAWVYTGGKRPAAIPWEGLSWARPFIDVYRRGRKPQEAGDVLALGDIVYVERADAGLKLAQVPQVGGALVSLRPDDGGIRALVGGFDYYHSKFNRATQARRQPGSNFKPFIYSAALANGFTTASIINDAPVVFEDRELEGTWRPENYSGRFYGPTRLREALIHSRNLVSIRILRAMGVTNALEHIQRFGFDPEQLPHNLSLALGSASLTPLEVVRGYAVLANGGYRVSPFFIDRVEDAEGEVIWRPQRLRVCPGCNGDGDRDPAWPPAPVTVRYVTPPLEATDIAVPGLPPLPEQEVPFRPAPRAVPADNVYLVTSMMRDVIRHGTGRGALRLGRNDLAGKTGTTNEQRDAWFSGFNRDVVTTAWVGYDTPDPLGRRETGARAALPMWIEFMGAALDGMPEHTMEQPPGLVTARIDPETGEFVGTGAEDAIFEIFRAENVPQQTTASRPDGSSDGSGQGGDAGLPEQLF